MCIKPAFLEKRVGQYHISIFHTNDSLSASIQNPSGTITPIDSSQIKCGIGGKTPHSTFIEKVGQLALEKIAAFVFPSEGQPTEIWVFEATSLSAPLIKTAKEYLKQDHPEKALKQLETAFKLQQQKGDTTELSLTIRELKKELFLRQVKNDAPLFLTPDEIVRFQEDIGYFKDQDDPFPLWTEYLERLGLKDPHLYYLSAVLSEHAGKLVEAAPHYLYLATEHPNPLPCLKRTAELVQSSSAPLAFAHFLERLDREWLIQLSEQNQDPEIKRWVLLKDALRMTFEESLAELDRASLQSQTPTCFICFNVGEPDVGKWLEQTLVPDLDRIGVKPLFSRRDLNYGDDLNDFQGQIRVADQAIIICTPGLKKKCDERKKAPTGVAAEIRLAIERYNDEKKWGTLFPLYLKGDQKSACPSVFFEPVFRTEFFSYLSKCTEASVFSYFAEAFELFGAMRKIPREDSRRRKDAFLVQVHKILRGEIDQEKLIKWREIRDSKIAAILKSAQERVSQKTQMINLPEAPKDFTGRTQELKDLHEACRHKSRVAVTGLGGIGKTALALKYANDYRSHYQFIHFMSAGTSQLVIDGLLKLADDLHVPKTDKVEERLQWLKTALNRFEQDYLLIFDGLDQIEAFEEAAKYLPERGHCLLLTTRMPQQSKIRSFELIELKPFSLEEAVSYLLKETGSMEKAAAKALAENLGMLPLALTHAVRYINSQKISIQKYLELFNQYELELFKEEYLELTKEEKTILTTWKISIDAIVNTHRCSVAKEVLEMMAFLSQAPIPRELVECWFKQSHPESSGLELGNALMYLCGYSMISSPYPNTYNSHLLVQSVTRNGMPKQNQSKVFEQLLITLSLKMQEFDEEDTNTWSRAKLHESHAFNLFENKKLFSCVKLSLKFGFLILLSKISEIFRNNQITLEIKESCLIVAEERLKLDHKSKISNHQLASIKDSLGCTWLANGNPSQALNYFKGALQIWEILYNPPNSNVASALNNIGTAYQNLGRFIDAQKFYEKASEIDKSIDQPFTKERLSAIGTNKNNIGTILLARGCAKEALEYLQEAKKYWIEAFGLNSPKTATNLSNIGCILIESGKAKESLEYYQQAHEIQKKIYGRSHPDVATSLNNIGKSLRVLGNFEEALKKHKKAIKVLQNCFGESHPNIAKSYHNIGITHFENNKLEEAFKSFIQALKMQKKFDNNSLTNADTLDCIGVTLFKLKNPKQAEKYHRKALENSRILYGNSHPKIAGILSNIGLVQREFGFHDKALKKFIKAQEMLKKYYDEPHPDIATALNNMGLSYEKLDKKEEAIECFQKSLKMFENLYGHMHPKVQAVQANMRGFNTFSFSYLRKNDSCLIYDLPSEKRMIEEGSKKSVKTNLTQEAFPVAIIRLARMEAALAGKYELKTASWSPDESIVELLKTLKSTGPFIIRGEFGKNYYEKPPIELSKESLPKKVQGWSKGATRLKIPQMHFVIIVGYLQEESAAGGGYVYFVDPQDPSDPENPQNDILYRISYQNLQTHAKQLEHVKGYALYLQ